VNKKHIVRGVVHKVPTDLKKLLIATSTTLKAWGAITPLARNEWICWIESAKKQETRSHRIKRTHDDLIRGKRIPCCWVGCTHR
jgi:uncharacterized protein YdeI (YjbR/CyaY-like superfamily)